MRRALLLFAPLLISATQPRATEIGSGFSASLATCETWILHPESWVDGTEKFQASFELGDFLSPIGTVRNWERPPEPWRVANHYWKIQTAPDTGFTIVVSDQLPICHVTGSGSKDMRPAIESVLSSPEFARHWTKDSDSKQGMLTIRNYHLTENPRFVAVVSVPDDKLWNLERPQVLMSIQFDLSVEEGSKL